MERRQFRIAGRWVAVDGDGEELTLLAGLPQAGFAPPPRRPMTNGSPLFRGLGEIAGVELPITCLATADGYRLQITGLATFDVTRTSITCPQVHPQADRGLLQRAAVGPPLVLALALQGVYCLHASAVRQGDLVVAFLGPAGAGKSALARSLAGSPDLGWSLLADDTLPVELSDGRAFVVPWFPQLKLGADEQPWRTQPERLPLSVAYLLEGQGRDAKVQVIRMRHLASVLAILSHTSASRLFASDLHYRHLGFAGDLAAVTPLARLRCDWTAIRPAALDEAIRLAP